MDKELMNQLRQGESVVWQGKTADFPLLDEGSKGKILRTWILTAAVAVGLLALYCSRNDSWSMGFIGLVLAIAAFIILSPVLERGSLRGQRCYITGQRAILVTRSHDFYAMELGDVDDFQLFRNGDSGDCLVLGSGVFGDVKKQLRWRACHPLTDAQNHGGVETVCGMIFYGLTNADAAAELLEARSRKKSA